MTYKRRQTRVVWVGDVAVGGDYPIRVQSMTTASTKDTRAVVDEIGQLAEAGSEIVRLTVPTQADCDNLPNIRKAMNERGIKVPLVADIHFTPSIALQCVPFVEKVRINPGNFADKKLFKVTQYSDDDYARELERIREKFTPLVLRCKEMGRSMRIGTNHGSLSDRIMNRYGDTPEGMVESALEFVHICEENDYFDIILSMKASNVYVMIQAYKLLVDRMNQLGMSYPLHLGVTEAGSGDDGRIKSAIGIGSLLQAGMGDTIRVSLTEDPVYEMPVAYSILQACRLRMTKADYISCPSCGRTLFDLQTTTEKIRKATLHLAGVKIGVMGCIVNGPGEMADADFGYVGTGPGKISLYVGRECVLRNIPESSAVDELVNLIKSKGKWIEAPSI
jgi:(E)-4-hydroxy-3-methylbut-2-enyl-diphosphate synthase